MCSPCSQQHHLSPVLAISLHIEQPPREKLRGRWKPMQLLSKKGCGSSAVPAVHLARTRQEDGQPSACNQRCRMAWLWPSESASTRELSINALMCIQFQSTLKSDQRMEKWDCKTVGVLHGLAQASYNRTSSGIMRSAPQHPAPSFKPALLVISHSSTQAANPRQTLSAPPSLTPHIQIVVKPCHFPLW